jgi:uroporphyrinogen decarboxylase
MSTTTPALAQPDLQGPHGISRKGSLTSRERWRRFWHGQSVDQLPDYEFGWWKECHDVWQQQGMPAWVDNEVKAEMFFGLERRQCFPANVGLQPGFQASVVEERADKRIIVDGGGVLCEVPKDGHSTVPRYLRFPIETRADWKEFKKRLDPDNPFRFPSDYEVYLRRYRQRDYVLGVTCGSLFGWIRNWMGFENACIAVKEDRGLIEDMMECVTELVLAVLSRLLPDLEFDFAHFWEDMAFRSGPMISPQDFKELMVPRYRRITDLLRRHGIDIIYVDCDGNILSLAPLWLEAGVNVMFPLEVQSSSDPVELRKRFGREMLLAGGVNKMKLIEGKKAIDEELARLAPLVQEGGFLPHVDHRCPPDVTYENYLYYLRRKRETFGIPD